MNTNKKNNSMLRHLATIIEDADAHEECLVPRLVEILKQGRLPTTEELEGK